MEKIAFITGITGQDGSYLAALLLTHGYEVHGTSRRSDGVSVGHRELGIVDKVTLHPVDITDRDALTTCITSIQPTEIYHLAAQSSVAESWQTPYNTFCTNSLSTFILLEIIRTTAPLTKFFNASSCEIFDQAAPQPFSLTSPRLPSTPYGISKLAGHTLTEQYRTHYGLFAVNGVLFPHESPLRQPYSFIKSVIRQTVACTQQEQEKIVLGYIDTKRDFGNASDYADIMWRALQSEVATDYIIATGTATSLRTITEYVMAKLGVPLENLQTATTPDKALSASIFGDNRDTLEKLNVTTLTDIYTTIDAMIEFELAHHTATP
jgi:GDPmannose 4,6-dehydratase